MEILSRRRRRRGEENGRGRGKEAELHLNAFAATQHAERESPLGRHHHHQKSAAAVLERNGEKRAAKEKTKIEEWKCSLTGQRKDWRRGVDR